MQEVEQRRSSCREGWGKENNRLKARRKLWLQVHLYLGLFVGAALVFVSLSGSLIVFASQLDTWLNADKMHVDVPNRAAKFRPFEEIIASAKTAIPPDGKFANRVSFPLQPGDVFEIAYNIPPSPDNYQVFVNPYTAEGQAPIGIEQAVSIANRIFPDGVITMVFLPVEA